MTEIRSLTSIVNVQLPLICCLLGSIDSTAATLFSETFSYSDGDLTTVSGGNWENSQPAVLAGLNPVQVVSGEAQIVNRVDVSEGVFHSFESQTTGTLYLGFDFNLDRLSDPRPKISVLSIPEPRLLRLGLFLPAISRRTGLQFGLWPPIEQIKPVDSDFSRKVSFISRSKTQSFRATLWDASVDASSHTCYEGLSFLKCCQAAKKSGSQLL